MIKIIKTPITIIEYKLRDIKLNFSLINKISDINGIPTIEIIHGNHRISKIAPIKAY